MRRNERATSMNFCVCVPRLLRQDQLVAVSQPQSIQTPCVLNHDFALLAEELLGAQARHAELAYFEIARLGTFKRGWRVHVGTPCD